MLHAVDAADGSLDASLSELNGVIAAAYDHVKLARRYVATLPAAGSLSNRLQIAEAELVRVKVALSEIRQMSGDVVVKDGPSGLDASPLRVESMGKR